MGMYCRSAIFKLFADLKKKVILSWGHSMFAICFLIGVHKKNIYIILGVIDMERGLRTTVLIVVTGVSGDLLFSDRQRVKIDGID